MKKEDEIRIGGMSMSRRDFLSLMVGGAGVGCLLSGLGIGVGTVLLSPYDVDAQDAPSELASKGVLGEDQRFIRTAHYWEKRPGLKVLCKLCPKECEVANLERGYCGVRENREGEYKTLVYSRVCSSLNADPVEKKPFYHFLPGSRALSLSTAGCNFECKYCQNWQISQFRPEQVRAQYIEPRILVDAAQKAGCASIAFTYGEPVVFYEYMYDTAVLARERNIRPIVITNGYYQEQPLRDLCKVVSGIKVDFKGFSESFYKNVCDGELKPVLRNLEIIKEAGVWLELVILVIPTLNDSAQEIDDMSRWVVQHLGVDVPMHFSRFHPEYKLKNLPSTPIKTLEECCKIARDNGVRYVYLGNVLGHDQENTYCPSCKTLLIDRTGYYVKTPRLTNGACPQCGTCIAGIWT